jgi:hypothetical protein
MGYRTGVDDINISFPLIIPYFVALPDKFFFQLFAFYLFDFAAQGAKCYSHYNLPFQTCMGELRSPPIHPPEYRSKPGRAVKDRPYNSPSYVFNYFS